MTSACELPSLMMYGVWIVNLFMVVLSFRLRVMFTAPSRPFRPFGAGEEVSGGGRLPHSVVPSSPTFLPLGDLHFDGSCRYTGSRVATLRDLVGRMRGSHRGRYKPRGLAPSALLFCPQCERLWVRLRPKEFRTFCSRCPKPSEDPGDDARRRTIEFQSRLMSSLIMRDPNSTWVQNERVSNEDFETRLSKWGTGGAREVEKQLQREKGRPVLQRFPCLLLELPDRTFMFFTDEEALFAWVKEERVIELPYFDPAPHSEAELRARVKLLGRA